MSKPKMYGYYKPFVPNNRPRKKNGFGGKRKGKKK